MHSFVFYTSAVVLIQASSVMFCSICNLYNWRYKRLGNLPHIQLYPEFRVANPGFFYDFQLINVGDFNGVGESAPNPYFYQVMTSSAPNPYFYQVMTSAPNPYFSLLLCNEMCRYIIHY